MKTRRSTPTRSSGFAVPMLSIIRFKDRREVMIIALTRLDEALRDEPVQLIAFAGSDEAVLHAQTIQTRWNASEPSHQQEMIVAYLEVFPDAPTLNTVDPAVGPTSGTATTAERVAERRSRVRGSRLEADQRPI